MILAQKAEHLGESAANMLSLTDDERIIRIKQRRWIGYPKAKQILAKMEDLLVHPKTHRMPNLLIVGETNNGKTSLVERFGQLHPSYDTPDGNGLIVPVMSVQAPPTPDEGRLYSDMLELLYAPFKYSDRVEKKQHQVITLLRHINLKILVIDEIHSILAGSLNKQRVFLNVIKYLGNELQIPIVALGTKDAFRAIQTDPQLANRFEPVVLQRWSLDTEFLRLLVSFERMLPLRLPSILHQDAIAIKLMSMCEGYIGELSTLLNEAAVAAIRTGKEKIDCKLLDELDLAAPSQRKKRLDHVL